MEERLLRKFVIISSLVGTRVRFSAQDFSDAINSHECLTSSLKKCDRSRNLAEIGKNEETVVEATYSE